MNRNGRMRRVALGAGAAAVLLTVFMLYLQPNLMLTLATQLWNCF